MSHDTRIFVILADHLWRYPLLALTADLTPVWPELLSPPGLSRPEPELLRI